MKQWNNPMIEELALNATAYNPSGGSKMDGAYRSNDGKFNYPTYAGSSGNSGEPGIAGNDPSINPSSSGNDFVHVSPSVNP